MDLVKKALGLIEDVEDDSPTGSFHVILSAPTLDRDGEVVDSRSFEPLPDHITFDIDHDMKVLSTVGSGRPFYADDGLLHVKGTYASTDTAQEVRTLVREKHIRTTSVTFMAAERTKDEKGVTHVTRAELLNGTFTPIPSNRESVVLSAKAYQAAVDEKVGARNSASDAAKLQGMHDAAVDLGAACPGAHKSAHADDTKTVTDEPADEEQEEQTADETAESTAEAADIAAKSAATPPEILARLSITENAARLAFGA